MQCIRWTATTMAHLNLLDARTTQTICLYSPYPNPEFSLHDSIDTTTSTIASFQTRRPGACFPCEAKVYQPLTIRNTHAIEEVF